jgi:hypothetical protein
MLESTAFMAGGVWGAQPMVPKPWTLQVCRMSPQAVPDNWVFHGCPGLLSLRV